MESRQTMVVMPNWVIFHVPHDSTHIPAEIRQQILLSDGDLAYELLQMTDRFTKELFAASLPPDQVVCATVSRLACDVERFEDDTKEPMAARGMGVIYTKTHNGAALRGEISGEDRVQILRRWYLPHHALLREKAAATLQLEARALIIDCHSYPQRALSYESDQSGDRPEICLGTDPWHTSDHIKSSFVSAFRNAGYEVRLNTPFSGALVPLAYYQKDLRLQSIMIEVRRDLYMNEVNGARLRRFHEQSTRLQETILEAVGGVQEN